MHSLWGFPLLDFLLYHGIISPRIFLIVRKSYKWIICSTLLANYFNVNYQGLMFLSFFKEERNIGQHSYWQCQEMPTLHSQHCHINAPTAGGSSHHQQPWSDLVTQLCKSCQANSHTRVIKCWFCSLSNEGKKVTKFNKPFSVAAKQENKTTQRINKLWFISKANRFYWCSWVRFAKNACKPV